MALFSRFDIERPWPTSMAELNGAERFVVASFRRWVTGLTENNGEHWSLVWNDFARQLGAQDGKAALAQLATLIKCLQCHARRAIRHHRPCCPCLGVDEAWVISLVAACQGGKIELARALVEWMVGPDGAGALFEAALGLSKIMRRHAMYVPHRAARPMPEIEAARAETSRFTVH